MLERDMDGVPGFGLLPAIDRTILHSFETS